MNTARHVTRRQLMEIGLKTAAVAALPPGLFAADATSQPVKRDPWQIGIFTRPWRAHDWRVSLDAIAEAGFKHAGIMSTTKGLVISTATSAEDAAIVGSEARKRGLAILSTYGGGFGVEQSLETGIADLKKLIDNCAAANSQTLMIGGTGNQELYQRYYKAITEVCDYAAEKRVGLVLKPHGGLNATGPQCRKAVELVKHKNFTFWYDPGNIYYYSDGKLNPVDDAATVDGLVTGTCIKDFKMTTVDGKIEKEVLLNPGDGMVDFPAVMNRLRKGGFTRGPLVIETLAEGELAALLASAGKAKAFVENLVSN